MEWAYCPEYCYFVTLTYSPAALPKPEIEGGSLEKKKFLQWLNNAQKDPVIGSFRYYAVGEYGEKDGRAHYHLAVFPQFPAQVPALELRWRRRYGLTHRAEINHARAAYLAQYTTKKLTGPSRLKDGQEPEFRASSRNPPLGAEFVKRAMEKYKSPSGQKVIEAKGDVDRVFRLDGRTYPIGDWALRKIREGVGVPVLHRERLANPQYELLHAHRAIEEEAQWDPEMAKNIDTQLIIKKRQKLHRGSPRM